MKTRILTLAVACALAGCDGNGGPSATAGQASAPAAAPTAAEADAFVAKAEAEFTAFNDYAARTAWVNNTYINEDTNWLNARAVAEGTRL
jgi:peptidyl-dipeptidase A